jgi:hypothetical protein
LQLKLDIEKLDFLQTSVDEFENYCNQLIIETIFDHNMKFKEFAFIFEDIWNNAEPHTERLDRHLKEAEQLMKDTVL